MPPGSQTSKSSRWNWPHSPARPKTAIGAKAQKPRRMNESVMRHRPMPTAAETVQERAALYQPTPLKSHESAS